MNNVQHLLLVDTHSFVDKTLSLRLTVSKLFYHLLQLSLHENSSAQKVSHQVKSEILVFQTFLKHRHKVSSESMVSSLFKSLAIILQTQMWHKNHLKFQITYKWKEVGNVDLLVLVYRRCFINYMNECSPMTLPTWTRTYLKAKDSDKSLGQDLRLN